ncbi:MAG: undecaprenyldiphospho-muramoylpentapeptide beta-N-acetylglucosaminyltransferase [Cyanobacteria bacterium]|nr:undecaprenyldiphospho-muramoylpentapeptide beta-N-acetylglucosaminyltransferase [Cyanobacteriota bacterium]
MPEAMSHRIVITGGGTGGHIYPALAVAEALNETQKDISILYVGKTTGMEAELVSKAGFSFQGILFSGMPRVKSLLLPVQLMGWLWQLVAAVVASMRILRQFRAQLVFGTGGYVSGPVLIAARLIGIPVVIHEPDARPGLVNRFLAPFATCVTAAFEVSRHQLNTKQFVHTGNPLRGSIIESLKRTEALAQWQALFPSKAWSAERKTLLIVGGSQGAQTLNQVTVELLDVLLNQMHLQVIHQTGGKLYAPYWERLPEQYKEHSGYIVAPFFDNMPLALALSDVAICRAGSLTLSEMTACHIPTILVPYPFAAANHQQKNAEAMVQAGAARMVLDKQCHPETILSHLNEILETPSVLTSMQEAATKMAKPRATQAILAQLDRVLTRTLESSD